MRPGEEREDIFNNQISEIFNNGILRWGGSRAHRRGRERERERGLTVTSERMNDCDMFKLQSSPVPVQSESQS